MLSSLAAFRSKSHAGCLPVGVRVMLSSLAAFRSKNLAGWFPVGVRVMLIGCL